MIQTGTPPRWYRSIALAWLCCVLVPPLGLLLLWFNRRVWLTGKIVFTVLAVPITLVWMHFLFGLRVHFAGDMGLIVDFWNPRSHIASLERQRAAKNKLATTPSHPSEQDSNAETVASDAAAAWPGFRGPNRDGVVPDLEMGPWPAGGLKELWRQPVGEGHASFAIAHGRAYTIEQRLAREVVTCYDLASGGELWGFKYDANFREVLGGAGPRATPTIDGDRLFALGATGELNCLEAISGRSMWHVNILSDNQAQNVHWGMSGSPLVDGNLVVVTPGGRSGKSVVAYDRTTGRPLWRSGSDPAGYASPMIATLCGVRQLIIFSGSSVAGHSLSDGTQLWSHPWITAQGINVCQPIVIGEDRVFTSSAYDHGSALLRLRLHGDKFEVEPLWQSKNLKVKFSSAVFLDGFIYGLDEAILVCLDAATGERGWKAGRYGYGQLLAVGNSLLVSAENGDLVRVAATPERHQELSRFRALNDKTWNHAAIGEGKLLVRNSSEMACYSLPGHEE